VSQHNISVALATTATPVPKLTPNASQLDFWGLTGRELAHRLIFGTQLDFWGLTGRGLAHRL